MRSWILAERSPGKKEDMGGMREDVIAKMLQGGRTSGILLLRSGKNWTTSESPT